MRTRHTTAAALTAATLLLTITGCSSDSGDAKPTKTVTAPASPTADKAAATAQCIDAVAQIPADDDGSVPSEPVPTECSALTDSEYLDAYMDGISQSNRDGIADLQDAIDDAAEQDQ